MRTVLCATKYLLVVCSLFVFHTAAFSFDPDNWTKTPATIRDLVDVQFLDFNTVVAVGGRESNDAITSIFRTANRGQTWDIILDVPYSPWLRAVHFPSTTTGFAAGYDGMLLRTTNGGNSWDTLILSGNAAIRDYNDVYFTSENIGFLVGGNQTNDSIQTILKTVDGGDNWQIVHDNLGYWLKAVQFVSSSVGFASGESGTLLKTIDGGDSWTPLTLQGNAANRHYNDVRFIDELNGIAIGGQEKNDSIRTILKTIDGGANWTVILDGIGSWLNGIAFLPSGAMMAVGNDSTILSSTDNGNTWKKVIIPAIINQPKHLNAVSFIHDNLGVVVGNKGQILFYEGTLPLFPTVTINAAVISASDSIWVSGTVAANGADTDVYFDYGPSTSLGFTMDASPSLILEQDSAYVEGVFSGIPEGIYYYRLRAENDRGISLSETRQFYIGDFYDDANLDFELWDEQTLNILQGWRSMGHVYSSPSYNGTLAVTLADAVDSVCGILWGNIGNGPLVDGFPVSATPDSLVGQFNYTISTGTDALIVIVLKKDGLVLSTEFKTFSGSSNGEFERLSFPISYSGSEVPDSILLAITNNNPSNTTPLLDPNNRVTIDDLVLVSSGNIIIPNADFELWDDVQTIHPTNWFSRDTKNQPSLNRTVFQTSDAQYGNFAVVLKNTLPYDGIGYLTSDKSPDNDRPSFPVVGKHATFNGYYKYEMLGAMDTVNVSVRMYHNTVKIGEGQMQIGESVSSYNPFEIEIEYHQPSLIPDSASIKFSIGNDNLPGLSVLYLDNLSFDGFVIPYEPSIITSLSEPIGAVLVYPNPSDGNITIDCSQDIGAFRALVYNSNGALVFEKSGISPSQKLNLNMATQAPGIYFLQLHHRGSAMPITQKLIIQ